MDDMKNIVCIIVLLCFFFGGKHNVWGQDYAVVASREVFRDSAWQKVAVFLQEKHSACLFCYQQSPLEVLDSLRKYVPRYVAFVEKPECIGREYVMLLRRMSRQVDEDIFADYLWGMITGYDAQAALKLVENSFAPLIVKSALSTVAELRSAEWFERYAWLDDHQEGLCGEKREGKDSVRTYTIDPEESLRKMYDFYAQYNPDLVVTSGHATERNLEMPFSHGNIKSKNGQLYAAFPEGKEYLVESGKRRVFLGAGNCLLGDVRKNPHSMAVACLGSGNAAAMVGYTVTSWYGRSGWGTLKYWLANSGRYTLAEALFLNEQDMLYQMEKWSLGFSKIDFPYARSEAQFGIEMKKAAEAIRVQLGIESPERDQIGFWYDRDVLAYYGDPKCEVRLQEIPQKKDYTIGCKVKNGKCLVKIKTLKNFDLDRLKGENFKQVHVKDLPFSYFFPVRIETPCQVSLSGFSGEVVLDKDFILIYHPDFKARHTYKIVIDLERQSKSVSAQQTEIQGNF